jgi:uncharacterized protein
MTRRIPATPTLRQCAALGLAVLLGACSSASPPRFHTLLPLQAPVKPAIVPAGAVAWEVLPVTVPAQVDQPQWVVRTADGSLAVLEQERWIAPLGDDIRAAVSDRLTRALGAAAAPAEPAKAWRVRIDVQRFESAPGREVRLEATWTLSSGIEAAVPLRCHGDFVQQLATASYPALAKAHQQGVVQLADSIARALEALHKGQAADCRG